MTHFLVTYLEDIMLLGLEGPGFRVRGLIGWSRSRGVGSPGWWHSRKSKNL